MFAFVCSLRPGGTRAWAVDMLDVAPDDRLLEIGCGAWHAVSPICAQLYPSAITTFDERPRRSRNDDLHPGPTR